MKPFFLLIELFGYGFALYVLLKKKELAILYLPVLIFINNLIEPVFPASVFYLTVSVLVFSLIYKNPTYYKYNIPAFILFFYILALLPRSSDLVLIRPYVFSILWLLTIIPTIHAIYLKYSRKTIFDELTQSALIILTLFILNALVSTLKGYSPKEMYGITSGILYGNVYAAGFNVLAISTFILALGSIVNKKYLNLSVLFLSFGFLMLSMRRSVMGVSVLGLGLAYLSLFTREKAKIFFLLGAVTIALGFLIYTTTDFSAELMQRYELRKLDERELDEEKRFFEYELLYKDMFIYRDYSPLIGYELFNSWGNYGRGILEDRSLHGDLTNITHSSGLIGLFLYLAMVITSFWKSFKASQTRTDKLVILFCIITFIVFTITGRYTEIASMLMLFLILMLPITKDHIEQETPPEPEPADNYLKLKPEYPVFSNQKVS